MNAVCPNEDIGLDPRATFKVHLYAPVLLLEAGASGSQADGRRIER
jgi:hypothetical protein